MQQAEAFGAEFQIAEATGFDLDRDIWTVHTSKGSYCCFGILPAAGGHPRTVGFNGKEKHKGRGVAYCAACDGEFFTGKEIFVVGGGYAAAEEMSGESGLAYARYKNSVTGEVMEYKSGEILGIGEISKELHTTSFQIGFLLL